MKKRRPRGLIRRETRAGTFEELGFDVNSPGVDLLQRRQQVLRYLSALREIMRKEDAMICQREQRSSTGPSGPR
jgi:hypothetical protein